MKTPTQFGAFFVTGDDAVERTLPSCLAGFEVEASAKERIILDGLSTEVSDAEHAERALSDLGSCVEKLIRAIEG